MGQNRFLRYNNTVIQTGSGGGSTFNNYVYGTEIDNKVITYNNATEIIELPDATSSNFTFINYKKIELTPVDITFKYKEKILGKMYSHRFQNIQFYKTGNTWVA